MQNVTFAKKTLYKEKGSLDFFPWSLSPQKVETFLPCK